MAVTVQAIEIAGQKMVILTADEFERLSEAAEHYDDICAAVAARKRASKGEEYVPAEIVDRILEGESALRVWRKYRGITQQQLGKAIGVTDSTIAKFENGRAEGSPAQWQRMAKHLNVDLEDILPALPETE